MPVGHFPWATLVANLSGSLAIGVLVALLLERYPPSLYARAFIGTGFLGAYTTLSTFAVETDLLVKVGHAGAAGAYVVVSLAGGLAAAALGLAIGRRMGRR